MEQQVFTAYAVLLAINTAVFLLCTVQMIKFARFYRNFNRVVSNVQSYLQCVMEEDVQEDSADRKADDNGIVELDDTIPDVEVLPWKNRAPYAGQASNAACAAMSKEEKEEVLNSVLGEIFS